MAMPLSDLQKFLLIYIPCVLSWRNYACVAVYGILKLKLVVNVTILAQSILPHDHAENN